MTIILDGTTGITSPGEAISGNVSISGNAVVGNTVSVPTVAATTAITPHLQVHGSTLSPASSGQYAWSATTPYYTFNRSAGAIGTYTVVGIDNVLGIIQFNGSDGASFVGAAQIRGLSGNPISTGVMPGALTFWTSSTAGTLTERMRIDQQGYVGIGVSSLSYPFAVSDGTTVLLFNPQSGSSIASFGTRSTESLVLVSNDTEVMRLNFSGNVGIGVTPTDSGVLEIKAGTTNTAPILLNPGSTLTNAYAGAVEFDGNVFYATADTTSGRGFVPTRQFFRRTTDATAFGPAIANFFGTTSGASLDTSTFYEVEYNLYFTKTTAGTVTFTLTFSNAPINCDANYVGTPVGGVGTVGTPQTAALVKSTAAASALPVTGSLTTAVNHQYTVKAIFQANATTGGTLNLQITSSAGTVTPLTGSYYKITRLPAANTGAFV